MIKGLSEGDQFLYRMLDAIPSMLVVVNEDVRVIHLNAAAQEMFGMDNAQAYLNSAGKVLGCINAGGAGEDSCGKTEKCNDCVIRRSVKEAARGKNIRRQFTTMKIAGQHGLRDIHLMITASPFVHDNEALVLLIMEDVSEQKETEEKLKLLNVLLERRATTDTLTGIYNRLRFNEFLDRELSEARRYEHALSLIMFDIDHFKKTNDTYGHQVGDRVLKEATKCISDSIREVDIFARWGGEEFMILSPHTGIERARQLAEKLRMAVESHVFEGPRRVTCSFGVTQFANGDTVESFTGRADAAMYQAKNSGRNRVVTIDGSSSDTAADAHADALKS